VNQLFIGFKKAYDSVRREALYNIFIDCGLPMKLTRLIKMCLAETYSRVRVGKNLSDMYPIMNCLKQGNALSPLLLNFVLEYVIRRVKVIQDGLKLNGTDQLLVYADDINTLGGSVHTIKEKTKALIVASKKIGLGVNVDKTKYMAMSRDQNVVQSHSMKTENITFEMVKELKYMETNLANQNSIPEEIKSRLKTGNACYHSVQNLLSSSFLSKNLKIKIKIYRTTIFSVVFYGCETWSLTLWEERRLKVFDESI
jgi:hypothetical protein